MDLFYEQKGAIADLTILFDWFHADVDQRILDLADAFLMGRINSLTDLAFQRSR